MLVLREFQAGLVTGPMAVLGSMEDDLQFSRYVSPLSCCKLWFALGRLLPRFAHPSSQRQFHLTRRFHQSSERLPSR